MPDHPVDHRPRLGRRHHILALPLALTATLVAVTLLPAVSGSVPLARSFWAAAVCLIAWDGLLFTSAIRRGRTLALEIVLRQQHYVQACAQGAVLLYWGWHWRDVYQSGHLIAAQILFAYGFDMLLSWSRRDKYVLGFGPVPVIFSINLFLWFKPDWFWLQFLMIAVAFAAKEFIRWDKRGRRVHIFNPAAFPLALFSLGLLLTGMSDLTLGHDIATTLNHAPHIYLMIFLVGVPGQFLFGVTTMTMSAVVTMYAFGVVYFALTGVYFFSDSYIPIAVFLGMHLLFTDPSTSPRTELGRVVFGMVYTLNVVVVYSVLGAIGAPTFYDKLLGVPIMNLMINGIDRIVRSHALQRFDPASLARHLVGRRRNLAYIGAWTTVFVVMSAAQGVGDSHRGRWVPFWQRACDDGRLNACRTLAVVLVEHCSFGSGWACNEYGILLNPAILPERAAYAFTRACDLGFVPGCANLDARSADAPRRAAPSLTDYPIILREGKGPLTNLIPLELYNRACTQGFLDGCEHARQLGTNKAAYRLGP